MPLKPFLTTSLRRDILITITALALIALLTSYHTYSSISIKVPWSGPASGSAKPPSNFLAADGHSPASPRPASPGDGEALTPIASSAIKPGCGGFPDTKDILIIVKTGATEAYDKLPIHFLTTLRCVDNVLLMSDMEMNMAGHQVIDVLADFPTEISQDNGDFELYRLLQEYRKVGQDPRPLKDGANGWNLDKYKFLHMLVRTWEHRQDASWYVFIEADTALIWDNLKIFLEQFDPRKPYYIGSPTYLDIEFAHGGTGYILSRAAMKRGVGNHPDITKIYDKDVKKVCCGDAMIARILLDQHIKLTKAWPMMNGEKPLTLPFSKSHWCQPAITMHHLTAQEVSQVWNFEQERKRQGIKTPLIWKDIYYHFVNSSLTLSRREDWDNLSNDLKFKPPENGDEDYHGLRWDELTEVERASPESSQNCEALCDSDVECFQWSHHDSECKTHRSIRMGGSKPAKDDKPWTSGWRLDRIERFKQKLGDCSGEVEWKATLPS